MAGALVGGAFLSASLQVLFDRLASREVISFIRGHKLNDALLKKLRRKLLIVHAVLNDAETKQISNPAVEDWMVELKDVVYDAEDVLDEIATEDLRCKIEAADSQTSMSTWIHPTLDVQSINSRVEEIIDRLEDIAQDRDVLGLKEGVGEKLSQRWPSTSLVDESLVYGRDEIKEEMIQRLLSDNARSDAISVISIVGMGGAGKTTLAQLLYNDRRVKEHFDLNAWICVSEEFDPIRVTKTILEAINSSMSNTTDLNLLQVKLKESIYMKKFLLVLDDVWNEDSCDWDKLQAPFIAGAKGSKIIVTTRSTNVAIAMRVLHTHCLGGLSCEDSWSLFKKLAFENGDSSGHPQLEAIGEKIVNKCQGLPLAIKAMGSLLHSKVEASEWDDVLNSDLWDLATDAVLPALRLSYHYLPSHLKRCFSYCSIFPKDYEFDKEKLVLLWMAEGLLDQSKSKKRMEEIGNLYFHELQSKSFFQKSISNESCFVMHDLVNDLAQLVHGEFSICLEADDVYKASEKTRHLSYFIDKYDVRERFGTIAQMKRLRTFLPSKVHWYSCYLSNRVLHHLLPEMKCLRVLCLSHYNIIELPNSIDNLKHLRYLDLSRTKIQKLPESVCNLYNLQTMMLSKCWFLVELPSKMGKLINLRYLDICYTMVEEMPSDICQLKNLQSLSRFIVGQNGGLRLGALRELSGSLAISRLENVVCDRDALEANMKDKKYLGELKLEWGYKNTDVCVVQNRRDILSSLRPHANLKRLHINAFGGSSFPDWVGDPSFFNLVALELENCNDCSSLPPLGQLPSLKHLSISGMKAVERVGCEFYHYGNASSSSTIKPSFPSLQTLRFERMDNWEKWLCCGCRRGEFPRLHELYIEHCPKLTGKLPKQLRFLKKLGIIKCELLVGSLRAPQVRELKMLDHGKFRLKRPARGFTNLQTSETQISDISQLEELPPELQVLLIRECDSIECLLEEGMLQRSTSILQDVEIRSCHFFRPLHRVGLPTTLKSLSIGGCTKPEFLLQGLLRSHHPFLEYLSIVGGGSCNSPSLSFSLSIFPRLNGFFISGFEGLEFLLISISEGDPTSLIDLRIQECPDLVYIELPALESALYYIFECRKLKLLARTLSSLQKLSLRDCPELLFQRDGLPSNLRELEISSCNELTSQMDWGLQRMASLTKFTISCLSSGCQDMESFPSESLLPSTLISLKISYLWNLKSLDSKGLQQLTSLTTLFIFSCPKLQSFGEEGLQNLTSLENLDMSYLPVLESLREVGLQHLTSLKELSISNCDHLLYLTKERLPNSLSCLTIESCPFLEYRCQFEKGQDWEYIAHIPRMVIGGVLY